MKLIFMGNGPFAVPLLNALLSTPHELALIVARPDLPAGKKQEKSPGPVAMEALRRSLPLEQPPDVNAADTISRLATLNADLLVVADFGQILSPGCLSTTRIGGINIHASLLPRHRGAAPVAWAILAGDRVTGVSIIQMTPQLDGGGVIAQESIPIAPAATCGSLEKELATLGAAMLPKTLELLATGAAKPITQDPRAITKAPKLRKESAKIDWRESAEAIERHIRAMNPWPMAFAELKRAAKAPIRLQIIEAAVSIIASSGKHPGQIIAVGQSLEVATGAGALAISRIKPAGKGEMNVADFLRGNPIIAGDSFA